LKILLATKLPKITKICLQLTML